MNNSQVSILLPVYNAENFLAPAIESILKQTWSNIEFVILDDGSTDSSWNIILKYALEDPRIRPYKKSPTGLVDTLNYGLSLCRNELIARMDADDISLPDRIEKQRDAIVKRPRLVLLGSSTIIIDETGRPLRTSKAKVGSENVSKSLLTSSCIYHPTAMFRKSAVLKAGGYRDAFKSAEDYDLWLRLQEMGEVDNLRTPLLLYRVHNNSVTSKHLEAQALSTAFALACSILRKLKGTDSEIVSLGNTQALNLSKLLECVKKIDKDLIPRCERSYYRSILYSGRRPDREETSKELDIFLKTHTPESRQGTQEYKEILIRAVYFSALRKETVTFKYLIRYLSFLLYKR